MMHPMLAEWLGTALLIILGNGVVANVVLPHSKGQGGGWIVIAFGWAMAVFVGVYVSAPHSGAHLNPAVSIALATLGQFAWSDVPMYIGAQLLGAFTGAAVVAMVYKHHFDACKEAALQLAVFSTTPAIEGKMQNLFTEAISTVVLILGILFIKSPQDSLGALDALPVSLLVLAIGLSLGGPTGYAINPARDLGPRLLYTFFPFKHKGTARWDYAWVPVLGPVLGAVVAAFLYMQFTA